MESSKYKNYLNIIRVFACFSVLFYHLNIFNGGFLAVNIFFTLFGYLITKSALDKDNFNIKKFYKSKLIRLYLPLITVIFVSLDLIYLFSPSLLWFNLKPETTSAVLLYNNYWQINANMDYFANVTDSPFLHLWYTAITMQFCLIFPFLYKFFNKIKQKYGENILLIILLMLCLFGVLIFVYYFYYKNLMSAYYSFESRIFSVFIGLTLAYIHKYYDKLIINFKSNVSKKLIFYFYLIILLLMMIFIKANNKYLFIYMILVSIITMRLISYALSISNDNNIINKCLKSVGSISYEIYLLQYPIIYLFSNININIYLKNLLIILIIFFLSYFIYYILNIFNNKNKMLSIFLGLFLLSSFCGGLIVYINTEDHTKEMNALKKELASNEENFSQMEKEYYENYLKEQEKYNELLNSYNKTDAELEQIVVSLPIIAVGDSVMLGAVPNLKEKFVNGYFNAEISRTCYVAKTILDDLKNQNMLSDVVIIHMGTNGDCGTKTRENIMSILEGKEVFWITVTNDKDVGVNSKLKEFSKNYSNMHIMDWETISKGHSEYFYSDGIHLTPEGRNAYTSMIYEEIFNLYKQKQEENKNKLVIEYENNKKNKTTFYGNDLLLNTYSTLKESYENAIFNVNKNYTIDLIVEEIKNSEVTNKTVLMLDNSVSYNKSDLEKLLNIIGENNLYIVNLNKDLDLTGYENVINFYENILKNPSYILADNIHLSSEGNNELIKILKETLK